MKLKRFNDAGVAAFRAYLDALRADPSLPPPAGLLDDTDKTEALIPPIHANPMNFASRMEFAVWLHEAARAAGAKVPLNDRGFWSWLTLASFDQVCPNENGKRSAKADPAYIPDPDYRRSYRHLLATSYRTYFLHQDKPARAGFLLNAPLSVLGELTEQFASRQEVIGSVGVMDLACRLFADPQTGARKSGASGGAARRLGKLLNQYMRTWDIEVMPPAASAKLLPAEFDRFREE